MLVEGGAATPALQGKWTVVPDDAVILGPNKFGRVIDANVCADRARASAEVIAASANHFPQ